MSTFEGQELSKSDRPELTSAETVISGGKLLAYGVVLHATANREHNS